jgi:hypothetical protein
MRETVDMWIRGYVKNGNDRLNGLTKRETVETVGLLAARCGTQLKLGVNAIGLGKSMAMDDQG